MCWSAETSFATLAVGTVLNGFSYATLRARASPVAGMVWAWQYALLMQIPEGVAWLQLDAGDDDVRGVSRLAMFLNVTQPVALFVGIRCSGLYHEFRHSYAVLVLYAVVLLTQLDEIWPRSASIAPRDGCTHLNLGYWDTSRALVYVTASFLIIAEARPAYWAITNALLFGTTLILAMIVYPCGAGSVWCWFIFLAGPILVVADGPPYLPTGIRRRFCERV